MLSRHQLFSTLTVIGVANAMTKPVLAQVRAAGWQDALLDAFGISLIIWLAIGIGLWRLATSTSSAPPRGKDWGIVSLSASLMLVPIANVAWVATAILLGWWLMTGVRANSGAAAGVTILLALSLREPMTVIALGLLAGPMLTFDAQLAGTLLGLVFPNVATSGNVILGPDEHRLLILTGCTSYTNLSIALLGWFAVVRGFGSDWRGDLVWHGVFLAIAVIGINVIRLALMGVSPEYYALFHDGMGADLMGQAPMVGALSFALWSLRNADRAAT